MRRLMSLLALLVAVPACVDSDNPSVVYVPAGCQQYTSCQTCTPVLGCGWCSMGTKGICVSQPNACASVASFTWTWELAYCPAAGDGGTSSYADAFTGSPPDGRAD